MWGLGVCVMVGLILAAIIIGSSIEIAGKWIGKSIEAAAQPLHTVLELALEQSEEDDDQT